MLVRAMRLNELGVRNLAAEGKRFSSDVIGNAENGHRRRYYVP
jgi:hypothetical protein